MSVDAHDLERAALQKKDREQLQSIATAMGRKPPSRARKGEIIDLILELAGSAPASSSGEPGAAPSEGGGGERASGSRRRGTRSQKPSAEAAPAKSEPSLFAADDAPAPAATAPGANGYASASPAGNDPSSSSEAGSGGEPARFVFSLDMPDDQGDAATVELENELLEEVSSRQGARPIRSGGRQRVEPTDAGKGRGRSGSDDSGSTPAGGAEDRSANGAESSNGSTTTGEPGPRDRADGRRDRGEADADGNDHRAGGRDDQGDRKADDRGGRSRGDNRGDGKADGRSDSDQGGGESHRDDSAGRNDTGESNRDDRARDEQRNDRDQRSSGDGGSEGGGRRRRRRGKDRNRDNQNQGDGSSDQEAVEVAGHLDLRDEGYGFLRVRGYLPSKEDVYVPSKFVRQFALRKGDYIAGASRPAGRGEKNPALLRVDAVNGGDPEKSRNRPRFEDLTPLFPDEKLRLELAEDPMNMTARIVDLIAPIGKGQRGLIVSPPKAGKTTVMKQIAQSIEHNNPEVRLIVLLVDERPEEVTDMRRSVRGEVCASTFDRPSDEHTAVAEMTMERAKRMVESGEDVVIILDGITRLARAYNLAAPATGRIMSGGIDTGALYPPKKFFGAARNIEEGGSLTILATALVETGSRMDEVIFEEFKGTGNMELRLDRRLAEKRIYPAFDVDASSTRHEELLFERKQLQMVWKLRRVLSGLAAEGNTAAGLELLIDRMKTFRSNEEFLAEVAKAPSM